MFLMAFGIRRTFGFADYESGGMDLDTDSHFSCLWIHFPIYYHLLILLVDFIINKGITIIKLKINHNKLIIQL